MINMDWMFAALAAFFALLWLWMVYKHNALTKSLKEYEETTIDLKIKKGALEEQITFLKDSQEKIGETFKALSFDALQQNNRSFLDVAKATLEKFQERAKGELDKKHVAISEMINPVKETLQKLDTGMRQLEKERKGDHESLKAQMHQLLDTERRLAHETSSLVKALRAPTTRGRWGEMQLKRVVELAGMLNHCDFYEQEYQFGDEGGLKPDLVVRLPGGKQIIVDAKTPLDAYLDAVQTDQEGIRELKLKDHARQVRSHVTALGKKAYWEHFKPTPEFVILFLPSETFYSAALEHDPSLIEVGVDQGVIIATPTTLIALLRAVSYGWKQESLSRHAQQVSDLGHDLYKRITDMAGHWSKMGRSLASSVEAYNKAVGTLEARVLITARKFKDLGAASTLSEEDPIEVIERIPRILQAPEMGESPEEDSDKQLT